MAGGPGVLEVETACDAIYVHDFSGEIDAFVELAFHGLEIDLF